LISDVEPLSLHITLHNVICNLHNVICKDNGRTNLSFLVGCSICSYFFCVFFLLLDLPTHEEDVVFLAYENVEIVAVMEWSSTDFLILVLVPEKTLSIRAERFVYSVF